MNDGNSGSGNGNGTGSSAAGKIKISLSANATNLGKGIFKGGKGTLVKPLLKKPTLKSAAAFLEEDKSEDLLTGRKQLITHIEDRNIETVGGQQVPLVIPLMEEEAVVTAAVSSTSTETIPKNTADITAEGVTAERYSSKSYGLQVMKRNESDAAVPSDSEDATQKKKPLLMRGLFSDFADIQDETERFRVDINHRPAESSLEDYDKIPIEEFGAALLRGMGWKDGEAVGKNRSGLLKPIELKRRPERLGLGAKPPEFMPPPTKKKRAS